MSQVKEEVRPNSTTELGLTGNSSMNVKEKAMFGNMQPFLGMSVEALDNDSCWYPGKIIGINESNHQVLVHFDGFNPRHDKWCDVLGNAIRPVSDSTASAIENMNQPLGLLQESLPSMEIVNQKPEKKANVGFMSQRTKMGVLRDHEVKRRKRKKPLSGLHFAFEGRFTILTEKYAARMIHHNGGKCNQYLTPSVNCVIIGENPNTNRLKKIREYGIKVFSQDDFIKLSKKLPKPRGRVGNQNSTVGRIKEENLPGLPIAQLNSTNGEDLDSQGEAEKEGELTSTSKLKLIAVAISPNINIDTNTDKEDDGSPEKAGEQMASSPDGISESVKPQLAENRRKSRLRKSFVDASNNNAQPENCVVGVQNCLAGLRFASDGMSCAQRPARLVYKFGGKFSTNVTARLDYLIATTSQRTEKVEKAEARGAKIIDVNGLLQLINDLSSEMINESNASQTVNMDQSTDLLSPTMVVDVRAMQDSRNFHTDAVNGVINNNGIINNNNEIACNDPVGNEEDDSCRSPGEGDTHRNDQSDHSHEDCIKHMYQNEQSFDRAEQLLVGITTDRINDGYENDSRSNGELVRPSVGSKRGRKKKLVSALRAAKMLQASRRRDAKRLKLSQPAKNHSETLQPRRDNIEQNGLTIDITRSLDENEIRRFVTINVQCPEKCGTIIDKQQVQMHLKNHCQNAEIDCEICGFKMLRKDVDEHISRNIVKHMKMLGVEMGAGKSLYNSLIIQNMKLSQTVEDLQGRVLALEQDRRSQNELNEKIEKQNQMLMKLKKKITELQNGSADL